MPSTRSSPEAITATTEAPLFFRRPRLDLGWAERNIPTMKSVAEILDQKGAMVLCVDQNESVFDAISLMADVNIGAVLVKRQSAIAGIFTERDYLQKVALKSRRSRETALHEVMTSPVITASPDDTIQQCLETMTNCRCRHLPVVHNGELLGILSIGDLVKSLLDDKQSEIDQLSHYIAGSY